MHPDIKRILTPVQEKAPETNSPTPEWAVQKIGIELLTDAQKAQFDALSQQLENVIKTLETIETVTQTVLTPIIAILRAIDDPFSAIIQLIVQEANSILQAFENQGIFILDMVSDVIVNNTTNRTFFEKLGANGEWVRAANQAILTARAGATGVLTSDVFDPDQLAAAGLKIDPSTGKVVPDKNSVRDVSQNLTPAQITTLGQKAVALQSTVNWITQYWTDVINIAGLIEKKFIDREAAVTAVQIAAGPARDHFVGPVDFQKSETDDPKLQRNVSSSNSKDSFNKATFGFPPMSKLVTDDAKTKFFNQIFQNGSDSFIGYTGASGGGTVNLNSTKLAISQDTLQPSDVFVAKGDVLDTISKLADDIAVAEKNASPGDITATTIKVYEIIEAALRDAGDTAMEHAFNVANVGKAPDWLKQQYAASVSAFVTTAPVDKRVFVLQNLTISGSKGSFPVPDAGGVFHIQTSDVIDTYAGFRNARFMMNRLIKSLEENKGRETGAIQRAVDFINSQVEHQGNVNSNYKPPLARGSNTAERLRPPRQTTTTASQDSSSSSDVKVSTQELVTAQKIVEDVTEQLGTIDWSKQFSKALKLKYKTYLISLNNKIAQSFGDLNSAILKLEADCTAEKGGKINSAIVSDIAAIINIIIGIKTAFYPFLVNQQQVSLLLSQVSDDTAKKQINLEKLFVDVIYTGTSTFKNTPYKIVNDYLTSLVKVFAKAPYDPFSLVQQGFTPNDKVDTLNADQSTLSKRNDFIAYFASIESILFSSNVLMPTLFLSSVNTFGFSQIVLGIINRINLITNDTITSLDNLRASVLSDLAAASDAASCYSGSSGITVPDRVKNRIQQRIATAQADLDQATNRRQSLSSQLASKLKDSIGYKYSTQAAASQKTDEINAVINQVGGFTVDYRPVASNAGTHYLISLTTNFVNGSLNDTITKLNSRINTLKGNSLNRDNTVADQLGDRSLRAQVSRNLAITEEKLAIATSGSQEARFLTETKSYLENLRDTVVGSLDASQSAVYTNTLKIMAEVDKGIVGINRIIDQINSFGGSDTSIAFTPDEKEALFASDGKIALVQPSNPTGFKVRDFFGVTIDTVSTVTNSDVITLFLNAGLVSLNTSTKMKAYIAAGNTFLTDSDYTMYVGFSTQRDDKGLNPHIPLAFKTRLDEFQKIKAALKLSLDNLKNNKKPEKNDAQTVGLDHGWLKPKSKNQWINEFVATLRDAGDIRRPIFVEDVNNTKAINAAAGFLTGKPGLGEAAQKHIDDFLALGEMTALFYVSASTDVEQAVNNIKNFYYMLTDPKKFQAQLDQFAQKIAKYFEDLEGLFGSDTRGIFEYFGDKAEDAIDRILDSRSLFNNTDSHCLQNFKPRNRPLRNDRWVSVKLADIFILAYVFDAIQKFLDRLSNLFLPKLGLGDLLQDLLDYITAKIDLLKKVVAGIGLLIDLIDFVTGFNIEVATLKVDNVRSVSQLEKTLRTAPNFPQPFFVTSADDPMYILAIVIVMPTNFYNEKFKNWFKPQPTRPGFDPAYPFMGGVNNTGDGPNTITNNNSISTGTNAAGNTVVVASGGGGGGGIVLG